jgi:hypothetical protein
MDAGAQPAHGTGHDDFIGDGEIISVHPFFDSETRQVGGAVQIHTVVNESPGGAVKRHVVQQNAVRGCTGAVATMLAADWDAPVSYEQLTVNLGDTESIVRALHQSRLATTVTTLDADHGRFAGQLKKLIDLNGPASISVGGELGGHQIIVDAIDFGTETAVIRDPHHGWQITIRLDSLRKRCGLQTDVIQVTGRLTGK